MKAKVSLVDNSNW